MTQSVGTARTGHEVPASPPLPANVTGSRVLRRQGVTIPRTSFVATLYHRLKRSVLSTSFSVQQWIPCGPG